MAPKKKKKTLAGGGTLIAKNRKAFFNYEILEEVEAGLVLKGTEVKSLRDGQLSFGDGHARFRGNELFLLNVNITPYRMGASFNHEPMRDRKLLLKKRELTKLKQRLEEKGLTIVPLSMYFSERGIAKVLLGVGRGKRKYDKRHSIAERDSKRRLARAVRHQGRE
ncbi:MAG: SsrA-binding protein SmpB [Planctomycetota bacterium]|jgi:SsrA-binding protein